MTAPAQQQQSAPDRRAAAAALAAAMLAAVKTPQAPELRALQAIRMGAGVTQRAQDQATGLITAAWSRVNPYDDASVEEFAARAGRIVVAAQRGVATATSAVQVQVLRAAGVDAVPGADIPDDVRGATARFGGDEPTVISKPRVTVTYRAPDGGTVDRSVTADDAHPSQVFGRAAKVYRYNVAQDGDHVAANDAAVGRIGAIVDGNLMLAQRLAEQQTLDRSGVKIWLRAIHPELSKGGVCGLCVAASDRVYKTSELKPIHGRCKCTVVGVTEGADLGFRLRDGDLDRLYTDAGRDGNKSTSGPALKRPRYRIVQHHELGPVLTRVEGESVPYFTTAPAKVDLDRAASKPMSESPAEVAARHLPTLRANLERLREQGFAESSAPVQYHLKQIAKFEQSLAK